MMANFAIAVFMTFAVTRQTPRRVSQLQAANGWSSAPMLAAHRAVDSLNHFKQGDGESFRLWRVTFVSAEVTTA
jgi:hypothetical protein